MTGWGFILLGVVLLWLLPGFASAIWCLASRRLRDRAVQLSRHVLHSATADIAAAKHLPIEAMRQEYRIQDSRVAHLIMVAVVLVLAGPTSVGRVKDLARARAEIRLE